MHQKGDYVFNIDSPANNVLPDRKVQLAGWIISKSGKKIKGLRVRSGKLIHSIDIGIEREDIMMAFPDLARDVSLYSGFVLDFECINPEWFLEVDSGSGYEAIHDFKFKIGATGDLIDYNPLLASNFADHTDLLKTKSQYYYEDERTYGEFNEVETPRTVAFYLPQYHPIDINDQVWGKGFTEWRNVASGSPRFTGHYQPMLPRDLGFYDLRLESVMKEQIDLAKSHGIYGFCFYYYWFSGKKILDTPLDNFLRHKEWDFKFMICWANENWTKRWDGRDDEVIIAQKYKESDPLDFIKDVEHILIDERYIHVDGKPVLVVYRPEHMDDPKKYTDTWQRYFKKKYNKNLHIVNVLSFSHVDMRDKGFDAGIEFVPACVDYRYREIYNTNPPRISINANNLLDVRFTGAVYDYRQVVLDPHIHNHDYGFPVYGCVMPSWDNDARKKGSGTTYHNVSPDLYQHWLEIALAKRKTKEELVFINAWNEWAEGTVLEPTLHYGHAFLNRTAETVKNSTSGSSKEHWGIKKPRGNKIASVIYLDDASKWQELSGDIKELSNIGEGTFIFIHNVDKDYADVLKKTFSSTVYVVPERGADVLPTLHLFRRIYEAGYKIVIKSKIGSKPGSRNAIKTMQAAIKIIAKDKDQKLINDGFLLAARRRKSSDKGDGAKEGRGEIEGFLSRIYDTEKSKILTETLISKGDFIDTDAYCVTLKSIKPVLDLFLMPEDFPPSLGGDETTIANAINDSIEVIAKDSGAQIYRTSLFAKKSKH